MLSFLMAAGTIVVGPAGTVRTLTDALALARPRDRIVVQPGTYREPAIVVAIPVEIVGEGSPLFEGGAHPTLVIRGSGVVIRGLRFAHVTPSPIEDRAAILLDGASNCRIEDNRIDDGFFGIYAVNATACRITGNRLAGVAVGTASSGNGIHLWRSRGMVVEGNQVRGHRDGIYFEFVAGAQVRNNVVERNLRYGLHFMRSDSCAYEENTFARNGAGVAVMYSRGVTIRDNRFEHNWGGAAYGLLLKDLSDGTVTGNRFVRNTVGLYLEGSDRLLIRGNTFDANGWAVKVLASSGDNRFEGNSFLGNSFDVGTNSRSSRSVFEGNWWDQYRGYDLDRDGRGDVPHRPVRLFSLVVEQHPPALILLRSALVDLLDGAERLMPVLTPETLTDSRPLMARPR